MNRDECHHGFSAEATCSGWQFQARAHPTRGPAGHYTLYLYLCNLAHSNLLTTLTHTRPVPVYV